jgi:hypothetical protein
VNFMEQSRRTGLVMGSILVLLGVLFLAYQLVPAFQVLIDWDNAWPLTIVGVGVLLLVIAVLANVPGLAVPAAIVGGIGCLLWWQNATGNWDSWAYAWALIPGFVGVGTILSGLLSGKLAGALSGGIWLILISLIMFFIFGSLMGGLGALGAYWPVLLIVLGFLVLLRPLLRPRG